MVKKIKKYLKFVVCCAIILSLIAPSYAALSASDGSAFVTKAEFDAALADFNSRLTTFEAGINSKIDSQVTSYLDRNGIWNGKAQTSLFKWNNYDLISFGKEYRTTYSSDYSTSPSVYFHSSDNSWKENTSIKKWCQAKQSEYGFYLPAFVASKSGLVMCNFEVAIMALNISHDFSKFYDDVKTDNTVWNISNNSGQENFFWHPIVYATYLAQRDGELNSNFFSLLNSYPGVAQDYPFEGLTLCGNSNAMSVTRTCNASVWVDAVKNGMKANSLLLIDYAPMLGWGPIATAISGSSYGTGAQIVSNFGTTLILQFFVQTGDVVDLGFSLHFLGRNHADYGVGSQVSAQPDIMWAGAMHLNSLLVY